MIDDTKSVDISTRILPDLEEWIPEPQQEYFVFENGVARAKYSEFLSVDAESIVSFYFINKNHYKAKMDDIVKHINYFLNFYDIEKEFFMSSLSVKFTIDQRQNLSQDAFAKLIVDRILTPTYVSKIKMMANDLYTININTDKEGKYKNTPKITNNQARMLVAISFALRMLMPVCIHYTNINESFTDKTDYIPCFDKIFMKVFKLFEKDDIKVFNDLCKFIKYRVYRLFTSDKGICNQKKQLYGTVKELHLETLIHEVILVKSLYKLEYNRSCVSFIDGVVFRFNQNFKNEKYKVKPYEISADDATSDSDDFLSQAEAMEMAVYKIDESNAMIDDINSKKVMAYIEECFGIAIDQEELDFYYKNCKFNIITQFLLQSFYTRYFKNSYAIYALTKRDTIKLLIYMKKYLQLRNMVILPQICTALIKGKFKDNLIKNSKFIEKIESSSVYKNIIDVKFTYINQLDSKDNLILKRLSTIINSTFIFVDHTEEINGFEYNDVNTDIIIDEFLLFLSII